ncbi:hypothetical protein BB559_007264 [Furculomyces boomerangus]|uniref:1,3-beta-glucanosyltransferase n=2 Tax=Harpellales TaxID=61421 RepID=A0A2T9XY39_9FUNG|nr:hypothetical protein BB559_007264 [Furculomyces boomerangus]PWA02671.1 hypothetical protein BB558_001184 [Smittium angustum]
MKLLTLSFYALLQSTAFAALNPLVIKGSKFFDSKTGNQFYFKGVDYQPRTGVTTKTKDPLADTVGCKRDAALFTDLGINSVRVYETDYTLNHDTCMKAFEDAGVYVLIDIPTPFYSINRDTPSWDTDLLQQFKLKVNAFSGYNNLAGFIIGNEVTNSKSNTPASAFVKASIRDIKTYIKSQKLSIPVGYVDNDDEAIRLSLISYFNCGDDPNARADFYGVNTYRWCGPNATFTSSGYDDMISPFANYSIPVIITEFGCNTVQPRTFKEIESILGPDMENISSGGLVYEFSQEDNNYGLVKVSYGSSDVQKLSDYTTLKGVLSSVSPSGVKMSSYNPSNKVSECPAISDNWKVSTALPPAPSADVCSCMMGSLNCGLSSSFSSNDTSQSTALGKSASVICGLISCNDVSYDTSKGVYGTYSFCNSTERSSWILNANYLNQKGASGACTIEDVDTVVTSNPKTSSMSSCAKITTNSVLTNPGSTGSTGSTGTNGTSSSTGTTDKSSSQKSFTLNTISFFAIILFACGITI